MSILRWADPPPRVGHLGQSHEHWLTAKELKDRPGQWAVVAEGAGMQGMARQIRDGVIAAFRPAGSFEAVTRARHGVGHTIYARYVGEENQ